jgi:hypothetical protein
MRKTPQERFLAKVNKEGSCWIWMGYRHPKWYGIMHHNKKYRMAHRIAYDLFVGDVGEKNVLHKCDTPCCVNPDHLFLGTNTDNQRDKTEKGRQLKGSSVGNSKLTEDDVMFIRAWRLSGFLQKDIAKSFGVSRENISRIDRGLCWA